MQCGYKSLCFQLKMIWHFVRDIIKVCLTQQVSFACLFFFTFFLPFFFFPFLLPSFAFPSSFLFLPFLPPNSPSLWPESHRNLLCRNNQFSENSQIMETVSIQFSSVTQSCLTLCHPMNRSTPSLPVHHQLLEFIQTHDHQVGDAIQPSHPLLSPSPPAPNPSKHQGFFQWVNSSHEVAKVLEFQLQRESFQWTPRTDLF